MWPATCPLLLPPGFAESVLRVAAVAGLHAASWALRHLVVVPVGEGLLAALIAAVAELRQWGTGPGRAGLTWLSLRGAGGVVVWVMDLQRAGQEAS